MPAKVFVDTNILVYAHDISAGAKHERARDLVASLWQDETGCLSLQVMQEFYVSITQKVAHPIDPSNAQKIIRDLSYWRVHEPKVDDVLAAIELQQRYRLSFWDAMILQNAVQLECNLIWSEDLNPGQVYAGVALVNPFL